MGSTAEHLDLHAAAVVRPAYRCDDGYQMSIQASHGHYCTPRANDGPWTHVEILSDGRDPMMEPWYAPCDGLHVQVPIQVVDLVIDAHNAATRVMAGDDTAAVMVDALREVGAVTSESPNPNDWRKGERAALVRALGDCDDAACPNRLILTSLDRSRRAHCRQRCADAINAARAMDDERPFVRVVP